MSVYSKFLQLQNGAPRTVDLSLNTLSVLGLQVDGATSGNLTQFASATTTSYAVFWPNAQGTAGTFLKNDGSGNLSWSSVATSSAISNTFIAGESFTADTSYIVRWGMNSLSESTDEVYKADYNTVTADEFWAIGIAFSTTSVSAGQGITVYSFGSYTLGSSDTDFATGDIGKPVWLTSAGAFSTTAPTGTNESDLKIGIVMSTTQIWIDGQMMGVGNVPSGAGPNPASVSEGGTGNTSFTPYAVLAGGLTSTGALQQVSGLGTSGYVLTSNGPGALPTWQAGGSALVFSDSLVNTGGTVTLVNDSATPGNTKYYGTNGSGTLGYYSIPSTGVTSVGLVDSTGLFNVTNTPITSTGNLTLSSFQNQAANTFLAAPNGSSGAPTFRTIVVADIPTLNQNTTGTAANITATSNSTLTTLSSLSLPGSQVSGNISGNAANITATSNSTLTTLSSLSLPTSQLSGTVSLTTQASGTLQAGQFPTLTGDVTTTAGSLATSLVATSNGTLTSLSALTTASSLASIGTITTGVWNGTAIGPTHGGTGLSSYTTGDTLYASATNVLSKLGIGSTGQILTVSGGIPSWASPATSGTVTSVALSDGSSTPIYSISGSPVTSSGTLTFTLSTQTANTVFAGPSTGSAAQPTFRSLVSADIPSLSAIYLPLAGGTMSGAINLGGFTPTNSSTPVNPNDLVNKSYVDNFINATSWKNAVLVATTANITLSGEQTIDGFTTSSSRVLVKNQSTAANNGIYVSASGAWARSSDMNTWAEVPAAAVFVQEGTVNADLGFVCTSQPGGTLGTTAITWVQFSSAGAYSADGITLQLVSGVFSVKNAGITETQIASTAFSTTGAISGGSGTKISVNVDNSTIDINGSDQLEVKAGGITNTQVSGSAAIAFSKLASLPSADILLGNGSNVATATAVTGDVTISNTGVTSLVATTNSTLTTLSGLTTASALVSVGTITTGTWNATTIAVNHGGTGQTTLTNHGVLIGAGTSAITQLAAAAAGTLLAGQGTSSDPSFTATPTLGINAVQTGQLSFAVTGVGGASITVQNGGATSAYNFNLPTTVGSAGQVLTSQAGGSTAMTWSTPFTNPMTTLGDIIYENATPAPARLAGNTTATKQFLTQTGTGSVSAAPAWGALASGDIPNNAANTSGTAASVSGTNVITNTNLAQMPADTIKGNNTGSTANAADLTAAQVLTMLGIFSGKTTLTSGATSKAITLSTAYASTAYSVTANFLNTTDTNPQFQPIDVTAQATTGFTLKWNMPTDTANYVLSWTAILNN